jgi:hypothetical protein
MQAKKQNDHEQSATTVTITSEMLKSYSETDLSRVALALYAIQHPMENERRAIACLIDRTPEFIAKCVDGEAHWGGERWLKIEKAIGFELFQKWLSIKSRQK